MGRWYRVLVAIVTAVLAVARLGGGDGWPVAIDGCDELVREHPADWRSYACYGEVARRRRTWTEAVARLESVLARDPGNHLARLALARIERDRGQPRAEGLMREAVRGLGTAGDVAGECNARLELSYLLRLTGRLDEAASEVKQAWALAETVASPTLLLAVLVQEGWLAFNRSDYSEAEALFARAADQIPGDGPADLRASLLSGLGSVLWATGKHREAYATYQRLALQHRAAGDLYAEADDRYDIALLASFLVDDGAFTNEEVRTLQMAALAAAIRGSNRGAEAAVRLSLCEDVSLDLSERIAHGRRALVIARDLGNLDRTCYALRVLAWLHLEADPDRPEAAFGMIDEAVERARAAGSLHHIARGLLMRAHLRWQTGPREQAFSDSLVAFDAIERIRDLQRDELVRARAAAQWGFFYYRVSGFLLRPGTDPGPADIDRALSVMERLRGRVLLDELDAARATAGLSRGPLREERDAVLTRIAATRRRLSDSSLSSKDRSLALADLARDEAEEASLRDDLARSDPVFRALRIPTVPSIVDVRQALAEDEALLAFQLSSRRVDGEKHFFDDGGSWLIVVTRGGARAYQLADEDLIEQEIDLFLGLVQRRDDSEGRAAKRLYRELLGNALQNLPQAVTRLIVIPDKALFRVPVEVLRPAEDEEPVGARYQVAVAPSAALWLRWRTQRQSPAPVPSLVVADPDIKGLERAADSEGHTLPMAAGLGPLPHARSEARHIVRVLGDGSQAVTGGRATETFLTTAEPEHFGVLHVAAHAVVDDENPERSAILLAPDDTQDGVLHIREVVSAPLPSRVVVLAACRSSAGPLLQGEGVMSLARAFFQAGATTVVGSLWPVRDDEMESITSAFYRRLGQGSSVGAALAGARQERLAAGDPAAAWAGLVVLGDGDVVPIPGGRERRSPDLWLAAVIAALAAASVLVVRRRRERRTRVP